MSSVTQNPSSNSDLNLILFSMPQSCLLQMATASMLLLVVADQATGKTLRAVGEASQEVFRGDRLPILDFPAE
ncbi:MAG: hypothetical protein F6K62_13585 [Sphaerospermopsis sp. SIO1G2]|nr:hypothetical protein [Sphaerospermopsis sp. SIO1G2]